MVICGGGVAAVEALLALRALIQVGIDVHLVAPNRHFVYQPLAVAAAFELSETHLFELSELCGEQDAKLHEDALESVDAHGRRVLLASGEELAYDALVVAVGAWRVDWLEGALHFGGAGDVKGLQAALARIASGRETRLCFVNPTGSGWTLPAYELALLSSSHLAEAGAIGVELTVATPEADPLAVFGPAAGRMVRNLLANRGIALKTDAHAQRLEHGQLHFETGPALAVDEVVALAALEGHAIAGLPCDVSGFLPVDEHGRVQGLADVYGAGDGTTLPIKQGGIAAQQADAVAEAIAGRLGDALTPSRRPPVLRGMLLTGITPAYLRAQLEGDARRSGEASVSPLGGHRRRSPGATWRPTSPGTIRSRALRRSLTSSPRSAIRRGASACTRRPASLRWRLPSATVPTGTSARRSSGWRWSSSSTACCRRATSRSAIAGGAPPVAEPEIGLGSGAVRRRYLRSSQLCVACSA